MLKGGGCSEGDADANTASLLVEPHAPVQGGGSLGIGPRGRNPHTSYLCEILRLRWGGRAPWPGSEQILCCAFCDLVFPLTLGLL